MAILLRLYSYYTGTTLTVSKLYATTMLSSLTAPTFNFRRTAASTSLWMAKPSSAIERNFFRMAFFKPAAVFGVYVLDALVFEPVCSGSVTSPCMLTVATQNETLRAPIFNGNCSKGGEAVCVGVGPCMAGGGRRVCTPTTRVHVGCAGRMCSRGMVGAGSGGISVFLQGLN